MRVHTSDRHAMYSPIVNNKERKTLIPIVQDTFVASKENSKQVSFKGFWNKLKELANPPAGSYDKKIDWYIKEAKLGNGEPLVRWVKEGLISSNEKNKKLLQDTFSSIPEKNGLAKYYFQKALNIIEEKLKENKLN